MVGDALFCLVSLLTSACRPIIHHLHLRNCDVVFCWIPGHIGIAGDEGADRAAGSALDLPNITSYPLPCSDVASSIRGRLFAGWRHLWHGSTSGGLHSICPALPIDGDYPGAQLARQERALYMIVFERVTHV